MTPEQIERVFGRGRLKMVTGEHVEVFREAVARGERRRYTKRFLNTREGDFGQWTEREWRILARLIGHGITCVPDVVQFDRGRVGGMQLVQTYDAGVTVDQWATLLPVLRDGRVQRHVFEDCAHWWALAHHCLRALNEIHPLELVHLDVKGDNVCIPYAPVSFDPDSSDLRLKPVFAQLALIDFAFALISRESLTSPLPIGWQKEYDYQSPRLLAALEAGRDGELQLTRELDWRCDMYSLAAMLKRYLPDEIRAQDADCGNGWNLERYDAARSLILRIRDSHDAELPAQRPHPELIELTGARLREGELALSLERGWTLAREASVSVGSASPLTPVTRLVPVTPLATPIRVARSGRVTAVTVVAPATDSLATKTASPSPPAGPTRARTARAPLALAGLTALAIAGATLWQLGDRAQPLLETLHRLTSSTQTADERIATAEVKGRAEETHAVDAAKPDAPLAPQVAASPMAQEARPPVPIAGVPGPSENHVTSAPTTPRTAPVPSTVQPSAVPLAAAPSASTKAAAKLAGASQRSVGNASAKTVVAATPSRALKHPLPAQAHRAHPAWAALEPPLWSSSSYRGEGPGEPPRVSTHPTQSSVPASAAADKSAAPAPASVTAARSEPTSSSPLPTHPVAAPRAVDPKPASARSSAPIEERTDTLALAFAPSTVASDQRSRADSVAERTEDDFAVQGRRSLLDTVPSIAKQAEPEVGRVLLLAASAYRPTQERIVADAARATRIRDEASLPARTATPGEARRLSDQARAAFASGRDVLEAFDLQLRAFNANPRDPEVAGALALLYLKLTPPQPERARQVALVALAARGPQYQTTRTEDWNTFAVASALAGRDQDAKNALFVTLALSGSAEPTCVAALNALANYGERLRGPVEAVLYRIHAQGRSLDSPWCAWPPSGSTPPRVAWPGPTPSLRMR
ncbi:MAG TPA: hypothetical protein VFR50_03820 [Casimicrobiaceae bacterium]|nr:hypothetical protein [Casimicrobiaceae bacterium]